jgi:protein tyrosine/serine phosphatase
MRRIETPVLFHCKSGADRAGFMAGLWLVLMEGRPVAEAAAQLSLRYGHFRAGPTGVLDLFFARAAQAEAEGVAFLDWIDGAYDREALMAEHAAAARGGLSAFFVERILRRE